MFRNRLVPPPVVQLVAVFAVTLILGPARSAEPADVKTEDAKRTIELLDKIYQRLGNLEARVDTTLDLGRDVKQIKEDISRLQREVAELRRTPPGNSTSNYPSQSAGSPPVSASVVAPAAQGRVRLVNNYVTDVTAVVNGTTVPVPPGRYVDVLVPPGAVTYQIPLVGQAKTTTLAPNEMLTLTLFPV